MARSYSEIKALITQKYISDPTIQSLYGLLPNMTFEQQFSKFSLENILFSVVAWSILALEQIYDFHKSDVEQLIATKKPHSKSWYVAMFKNFRFGQALPQDEIEYDNTGLTQSAIDAMKVVKHCAANERPGGLTIKLAGESGGDLAPLPAPQFAAVQIYGSKVGDAGVNLHYVNSVADSAKLHLEIYYDPLVLSALGELLSNPSIRPVEDAIHGYLKQMPFNGLFIPKDMEGELKYVEGVKIANITLAESRYGALAFSPIPTSGVVPYAGYLRIMNPADLVITYMPFYG